VVLDRALHFAVLEVLEEERGALEGPPPPEDEFVPPEEEPVLLPWVAGEAQEPPTFSELPVALSAFATLTPNSLLIVC
jgi:hypothetical protein